MKIILKTSILILLIISFSCSTDEEINDNNAVETKNNLNSREDADEYAYPETYPQISNEELKNIFGHTSLSGPTFSHGSIVYGPLDRSINSINFQEMDFDSNVSIPCHSFDYDYNFGDYDVSTNSYHNIFIQNYQSSGFYLDASGNLTSSAGINPIPFETWVRPTPPVNGQYFPSANDPLSDGVISHQEQIDLVNRIITALSTISYNGIPVTINIDAHYSTFPIAHPSYHPYVRISVFIHFKYCNVG